MSIPFRVGRYIGPSGFALAVVDVPALDPEKNLSIMDYSHRWEENVASAEASIIRSYVDLGGHMPQMTVTDFVVTNETTKSANDLVESPLWYRHRCRFYHYTYGENPSRQVYITDGEDNILKDLHYKIKATRIIANVYRIEILTDFQNNSTTQYKVKYNRCLVDGTSIHLGWVENLNATNYFNSGSPFTHTDEYTLSGPDANGLYTAIVPPVPTLSTLTNNIGVSFENCPTIIETDVTNYVTEYSPGVIVTYTLKATGPTTYTIKRNYDLYGVASNTYLQSYTSPTWGATPFNFIIGNDVTGIYGMKVHVHGDNYLGTNDEASFTAKRSYYYLMPVAYSAIYLKKPEHVTPDDDWYVRVRNGKFRRRMDASGIVVASGCGTLYEFGVPEWANQMWDLTYGPPYKKSLNERLELLDKQTVQLQRTPLYVDPSSVMLNPTNPGFAPTGYLQIYVNDTPVAETGVLDWDVNNGTVKLSQYLSHRDDIVGTYIYKEEFYEYQGFVGSGGIYPDTEPFDWVPLDLNPTPEHNFGLYASGTVAHIYLKPYIDVDNSIQLRNEALYHNFTGVPSGVLDFHIGSVSVGPHCKISDITVTDVRVRGGGLSQIGIDNLDKVKEVQPETEFFWDVGYFDGQAVPANGALVIEVPKTVLSTNGGVFTEDEVRQKVQKHMALGVYPIIEYV